MDIFEQLAKVDFLDIYDEIAEIPISNDQVIKMCLTIPCKVDLRRGNLVYLVEQKYKDKLSTYKKCKILKWLKVNLPRLFSNPEAKYLKWQERLQRRAKIEWLKRKAQAIQQLPPPISGSSDSEGERDDATSVAFVNETQMTSSLIEETSNTTAETVNTVILSQPKSTQEILPGFSALMEASKSSVQSCDLPPIFSNSVSSTQIIDGYPCIQNEAQEKNKSMPQQLSEGFSSQEDQYNSFSLDNMVTSTQEFG